MTCSELHLIALRAYEAVTLEPIDKRPVALKDWLQSANKECPEEERLWYTLYQGILSRLAEQSNRAIYVNSNSNNDNSVNVTNDGGIVSGNFGSGNFVDTHNHVVSRIEKSEGLSSDLATALVEVMDAVKDSSMDEDDKVDAAEQMEKLRGELTNQSPNESRLKKYFSRVWQVAAGFASVVKTLTTLGGLIGIDLANPKSP